MALALYDRVQQTGTANTTVSFTLSGSVTVFVTYPAENAVTTDTLAYPPAIGGTTRRLLVG